MDIGTGLALLGSAQVAQKILGPTADYVGDGLRTWTEKGTKNVGRIFQKAQGKLGGDLELPGAVPPKVLKGILQEGPFCDEELTAEYFGGVLASSRTRVGRDDRGAAFISLIGRLSSYQVRAHFFFYSAIRTVYEGLSENIGLSKTRHHLTTFVPMDCMYAAMDISGPEDFAVILSHVMYGLSREDLIEGEFTYGSGLRYEVTNDRPGLVFAPSALGIELFLWAHGKGNLLPQEILNPKVELESDVNIRIPGGIRSTVFHDRGYPKPSAATSAKITL